MRLTPQSIVFIMQCFGGLYASTKDCPPGWKRFENSCYMVAKDTLNWGDSQANCSQMNAHLVTVSSQRENVFLERQMIGYSNHYEHYWIGLYRAPFDYTVWSWIDGSQVTFTNWWPTQPDNYNQGESCGEFYSPAVRQVKWNDLNCSKVHHFICEKELGNLSSCLVENGGCEHVCISTLDGLQCKCKDGFISAHDGKMCLDPSVYRQSEPQASHSFPVASLVLQLLTVTLLIPVTCALVCFYRRVSRQRRLSPKSRAVMINPPAGHAERNNNGSPLLNVPSDEVNESESASHV